MHIYIIRYISLYACIYLSKNAYLQRYFIIIKYFLLGVYALAYACRYNTMYVPTNF